MTEKGQIEFTKSYLEEIQAKGIVPKGEKMRSGKDADVQTQEHNDMIKGVKSKYKK